MKRHAVFKGNQRVAAVVAVSVGFGAADSANKLSCSPDSVCRLRSNITAGGGSVWLLVSSLHPFPRHFYSYYVSLACDKLKLQVLFVCIITKTSPNSVSQSKTCIVQHNN